MNLRKLHLLVKGFPNLRTEGFYWLANKLNNKKVLEVGAGQGWIASKLTELGIDITPTDLYPNSDNPYWKGEYSPFVYVEQKEAIDAVKEYDFDVLLMSWPCYGDDWAYETLKQLPCGKDLLYIGESYGGCCATPEFFELIDTKYKEWEIYTHYEPFDAIHDQVIYYKA